MNRGQRKSILPYIPGYDNNAALKLVFFVAGAYIVLALTWATFMIVNTTGDAFDHYMIPNIALPAVSQLGTKWWTLLTYGFFHVPNSFMHMLSNMLWLYMFSSVVQMLVGKQQVAPIFVYSLIAGGLFYSVAQLLPGKAGVVPPYMMGPRAGMMAMCAAAITLSPKYRFYFTETFSIPMAVVAGIFTFLMLLETGFNLPIMVMLAGGALTGLAYVKLLRTGYRPGAWVYNLRNKMEQAVTPGSGINSNKKSNVQAYSIEQRVDEILDKINRKGIKSLTTEEREILKKAGH
jgi:membrane associated rhomboid family serine protease